MKYLLIFKNASDGRERGIEVEEVQARALIKKLNSENALFFFEVNTEIIQKNQIIGFSKIVQEVDRLPEPKIKQGNGLAARASKLAKKEGISYLQAIRKLTSEYGKKV